LGLEGESLIKFCGFIAGSHDLGKVSPAFQFQVSEVGKALVGDNIYSVWHDLPSEIRNGSKTPHGTVTAKTLPDFLIELGVEKKLSKKLAAIVGGHHGFFPSNNLADWLQHQSGVGGFYIGLPTQATSNAMWKRVQSFLGQRYSDKFVNLTLSHSAAALKPEYQETICRFTRWYSRTVG
jgi:CRISPR-associated endonuclease Cas3-HD